MFDEDERTDEEIEEEKSKPLPWRIIKKSFSILIWAIIIGVNVLLLCRMFFSGDPAKVKGITVDSKLAEAYKTEMNETGKFTAVAQVDEAITHEKDEEKGYNFGYFAVTGNVFFPSAEQAQIVFRYNNSTLRHLAEDYSLSEIPSKDGDWFNVTLRVIVDRTPDNKKDNGKTYWEEADAVKILRFHPSDNVITETKPLYSYRRFSFSGVPSIVEGDVLAVYADVYYKEDIDYTKRPYGSLLLYTFEAPLHDFKLSRKDIKALEAFISE